MRYNRPIPTLKEYAMAAGNYGVHNNNVGANPQVKRAAVVPPTGGPAPAGHPAHQAKKPQAATTHSTTRSSPSPSPRVSGDMRGSYYHAGKSGGGGISGGSAGVIMVAGIVLILATQWKTFVTPAADIIWNKGSTSTISTVDWKIPLSMGVLLALMIFIASINADLAAFMTVIVFAFAMVYLVETNGGGATALINWLNPNYVNPGTSATPPTSKTPSGAPAPTS